MVPKATDSRYSLFDIAGPVMVGPSSSHTAGACKIGQYARALFNKTPEKVTFILHGSFGQVFKGHATDRALLAGVMRFKTSDPALKNAFQLAKEKNIDYEFIVKDLDPKYHANTVKIILEAKGQKPMSVIGSSIGGGKMMIVKIDQFDVEIHGIAGKFKTLVCSHDLKKTTFPHLLDQIAKLGLTVASLESTTYDGHGLTVVNYFGRRLLVDELLTLEKCSGVEFVRCLTKVSN